MHSGVKSEPLFLSKFFTTVLTLIKHCFCVSFVGPLLSSASPLLALWSSGLKTNVFFSLLKERMCLLRVSALGWIFSHEWHWNSLLFSCDFAWVLELQLKVNCAWHSVQEYGFSPVCFLVCFSLSYFLMLLFQFLLFLMEGQDVSLDSVRTRIGFIT